MEYELFYLVGASRESELEKIKGDVTEIINSNEGKIFEKQTEEKRRMAYKIKHETHGIYIALRFELENPEKIKDINNKINLYPGVLRFIISKAFELPELKSKEERMNESASRESSISREPKKVEKEEKKEEKEEVKPQETHEEKSETQEDIDKKLEEILNI